MVGKSLGKPRSGFSHINMRIGQIGIEQVKSGNSFLSNITVPIVAGDDWNLVSDMKVQKIADSS